MRPDRCALIDATGPLRTSPRPGTPRVIVVDDDSNRRTLSGVLRDHRFDVATAADGVALDRRVAEAPPDLILLDVMMPGADGLSVLRRLRGPGRPGVIILSSMGDDSDRIASLDLGAGDYLAKPCNPRRNELLEAAHDEAAEIFDHAIDVTISRLRHKREPEKNASIPCAGLADRRCPWQAAAFHAIVKAAGRLSWRAFRAAARRPASPRQAAISAAVAAE